MQKAEYAEYFRLEMHKTLQIPMLLKAHQKQHCKLQHFFGGWSQKMPVFTQFLACQENVEGTKHCK